MADPLSSVPPAPDAPRDENEDARIEQLLVTGLDHYFASEFDQAINLWTRVLFLNRSHDRARAYIERARSAQAERLRQTEALVHEGLEAFDRGEVDRARALLRTAIERGASHDLALSVLGRIDRLDVPASPGGGRGRARRRALAGAQRPDAVGVRSPERYSRSGWWALAAVGLMGVAAAAGWRYSPEFWTARLPLARSGDRVVSLPVVTPPVPGPRAAEAYLARGRHLFETGRLRDALVELEKIPIGNALRADADRLRGSIQRELLALALPDTASRSLPFADAPGSPPE
jgi:tetratricopeptide (TPR) repeat protein